MAWILLMVAACLEVAWALTLRMTEGYTQLWPSVISSLLVALNVYVLSLVFKSLPTALAYPVWVSLGIVGTAFMSHLLFKEPLTLTQILFIMVIMIGVAGLKTATI